MPEYEQELYRKPGTKHQKDILHFNKEQTIVFDGHCMPDLPLAGPIS